MGRADTSLGSYLKDPKRFADVFNHGVFQGEITVLPEKLKEIDSVSKQSRGGNRVRDLVKQYMYKDMELIILAIENQYNVQYFMPLKNMLYDSDFYNDQRKAISKKHKEKKDVQGDEFLSGFSKKDKLRPIITLVIYYGDRDWDGPRELYDMLELPDCLTRFKNLIQNYKINLLEVTKIENLDDYSDDIKVLFGFIKYQKNASQLKRFINENKEIFSCVSRETCSTIESVTKTKELQKYIEKDENEEVNMCQAITDMIKDSEARGEKRGEARGEARGKTIGETRLSILMNRLFEDERINDVKKAINDPKFRKNMYQEYGIK
ncbi:MAG: Rpn family recombination-promoting nuclease/putative transposase [Anaerostipes sp.]|nr:Rpn family recombination-promoting nuclease/putative transposase [Anaerostipes sp.]MDD3745810.1 Rpn family recombination-promoting nuclease/putative transposase [Anaerostipes sp.]